MNRKTARIVGALYVTGTAAGALSLVLTGPLRNSSDYLVSVPANETRVVVAALFVLMMGLALAMIPVVMFPILRKHNEALALGYIVLRGGLEAVCYIAIATGWLLLVALSQAYAQAGGLNASDLQASGTVLLEANEIGYVLTIIFCLGALVFNYLLYRTKLVPRWLSGWGFLAVAPYLSAGLLSMFGIADALSPIYATLNLPLALQEMVLAVWLIAKGFDPSATVSYSAEENPGRLEQAPLKQMANP